MPVAEVSPLTIVANGHESSAELDSSWAPPLLEEPIHHPRPLRVIVIGGGFGGICAAVNLQQLLKNIDLQLYDMSPEFGGVWHYNRYAGVACDVPGHTYQFSFAEKTQWSSFYAPGHEIKQYLQDVAKTYQLHEKTKLCHQVTGARWDHDESKWFIEIKNLRNSEVFVDVADFMVCCTGVLSKPQHPNIPGINTYKGKLRHSATWDFSKEEADSTFKWSEQRFGVIGNGASGVQIVPAIAKMAKQVVNFGRSKIWLSSGWATKSLKKLKGTAATDGKNYIFTQEQKAVFQNPEYYREWRAEVEADIASTHELSLLGHPVNKTLLTVDSCISWRRSKYTTNNWFSFKIGNTKMDVMAA